MSDNAASEPTITFLGAARTVTGSMHLLEAGGKKLLVDCGLFQGRREEARERNEHLPRAATKADAMILTHAHIDHAGNIPRLVKDGFRGKVHCTRATADLCRAMLTDSARIQVADAMWLNKKFGKEPGWVPVEPLYDEDDAARALRRFEPQRYEEPFSPLPGLTVRFIDAGHILGSASALVDIERDGGERTRVVFSGDIGRRNLPILRDPVRPERPDFVVMETTYGDRMHAAAEGMLDQLEEAITETRKRGGKVIIPSFAMERTQEIVYALNQLFKSGRIKPLPVFLDSPLAINLTEVFRRHAECYDAETLEFVEESGDPFGFAMLRPTMTVDQSKALNHLKEPAIIIAASGMCEFGRVVHHLRNSIGSPRNSVLIVGWQAPHTLGRRIVEKRKEVKIFGLRRPLRCRVRVLNAFSAHADRDELVWWTEGCGPNVTRFFLVHGEEEQSLAFGHRLRERGRDAYVPEPGETVPLRA